MKNKENVVEWLTGHDKIAVSLTQAKYINKVKKLAKRFPDDVQYTENSDGSIFAHLPLKALKLSIIKKKDGEDIECDE